MAGAPIRQQVHVALQPNRLPQDGFRLGDETGYRNHAVTLAVFDWRFGTIHIPKRRPWRYGVPGPCPHWAEELLHPLVRIRPKPAGKADGTVPDKTSLPLPPSAA